nr:eukaryotic translation initiation factor 3 subunit J-like [Lolium perenne]
MSSAGRGEAAAPPPPPASSSNEEFDDDDSTDDLLDPIRDANALAEAEKEAEEERAAHAAFDAEMERRREAAVAAAEDDDSNISWSSDDPDAPTLEEKTSEQRALVESFETLNDDTANAMLRQVPARGRSGSPSPSGRTAGDREADEGETQRRGRPSGSK